jgi:phosphopantothenoylcysteine decarboxylase/phosphopantothenate--cysteine ligase
VKFKDKQILVGVSGSISAYKACDLVREFRAEGAKVRVVMTHSAVELISPTTFAALSGEPPMTPQSEMRTPSVPVRVPNEEKDSSATREERLEPFHESVKKSDGMEHIHWARWADIFVIAPATAHTIGELAQGLTQSPIGLLNLAYSGKAYVAPAMNTVMYQSPAVQSNLKRLQQRGIRILPTGIGTLACGEIGEGKLLDVPSIVEYVKMGETLGSYIHSVDSLRTAKTSGLRQNISCLVVLGHTREKIDDIRYISNRSSGKTGFAVAEALQLCGIQTDILCGTVDIPISNQYIDKEKRLSPSFKQVHSTQEFYDTLVREQSKYDVLILAAALSDFVPVETKSGKLKGSKNLQTLSLKPSPHVLKALLDNKPPKQCIVGFALENTHSPQEGLEKWKQHPSDILILNTPLTEDPEEGIGQDYTQAQILHKKEHLDNTSPITFSALTDVRRMSKYDLAKELVQKIIERYGV